MKNTKLRALVECAVFVAMSSNLMATDSSLRISFEYVSRNSKNLLMRTENITSSRNISGEHPLMRQSDSETDSVSLRR